MAGIGFELKKLFRRKGLFASLRAYGYAGIICTGPMLLGVVLQFGILLLCGWVGAQRDQQDLLVCMITYTLLFSLTVTSFFSMPVTRYLADMLYEEQEQTILPSFWGSSSMMLVLGCTLYGLFLLVSGATLLHVTWKRKIVTESRLAICQIRDNFAEKESRNPKDDTESKPSGFSKKKKYNRE